MLNAASIGDEFTDLLGNVVSVAVKVVIFLAIMALGWIVGRWIRKVLAGFLRRVGFDRAVERGGLDRMLGNYTASDVTARLVMYTFLLFVLQLAFGIFGPNPVSALIAGVIAWLPRLFVAIVIVVVTAAIAGWVKELIAEALGGLSYGKALATAAQVLVLLLGITAALNQIGVASSVTVPLLVAVLATVAGVVVVGVGGGLIKPMQHRWERMLNRAETETSLAAEKVRAHRAARATTARDANVPGGFEQPAYGRTGATGDVKTPETAPTTEEHPTQSTPPPDRG
jgi:Mechanosensitive ion channel, conserved TM helix